MATDGRSVEDIIAGWEAIAAKVERPAEPKKAKRKKGRSLQNLTSFLSKSISDPLPRSSSSANISEGKKEEKYTSDEAKDKITTDLFSQLAQNVNLFAHSPRIRQIITRLLDAYYKTICLIPVSYTHLRAHET